MAWKIHVSLQTNNENNYSMHKYLKQYIYTFLHYTISFLSDNVAWKEKIAITKQAANERNNGEDVITCENISVLHLVRIWTINLVLTKDNNGDKAMKIENRIQFKNLNSEVRLFGFVNPAWLHHWLYTVTMYGQVTFLQLLF